MRKKILSFLKIYFVFVYLGCSQSGSSDAIEARAPRNYKSVSVGGGVTCAADDNRKLYCWGLNSSYQLGLNYGGGASFVASPNLTFNNAEVHSYATNGSTLCVVNKSDYKLYCVGANSSGELGQGTKSTNERQFSLLNIPYAGQVSINGGGLTSFACANTSAVSGTVYCWGGDYIGNGTTSEVLSPALVDSGRQLNQAQAGAGFACGIYLNKVWCWGKGYLGNGNFHSYMLPQEVVDTGVVYSKVFVGNHICAITNAGVLKCWGNTYGDGVNSTKYYPTVIDSGVTYSSVAIGNDHACGITTSDELKCWGGNNYGQVGDGTNITRSTPRVIDSGVKYRFVSAGGDNTCAITLDYKLKCWGNNSYGQIGDGSQTHKFAPVLVY